MPPPQKNTGSSEEEGMGQKPIVRPSSSSRSRSHRHRGLAKEAEKAHIARGRRCTEASQGRDGHTTMEVQREHPEDQKEDMDDQSRSQQPRQIVVHLKRRKPEDIIQTPHGYSEEERTRPANEGEVRYAQKAMSFHRARSVNPGRLIGARYSGTDHTGRSTGQGAKGYQGKRLAIGEGERNGSKGYADPRRSQGKGSTEKSVTHRWKVGKYAKGQSKFERLPATNKCETHDWYYKRSTRASDRQVESSNETKPRSTSGRSSQDTWNSIPSRKIIQRQHDTLP